jgi:NarL family two-component system response regulator LiaR
MTAASEHSCDGTDHTGPPVPGTGQPAVDIHHPARIRVVIADDHTIVRKGIRALLATERDIEVVGEAEDGAGAVAQTAAKEPDVVLMDLVMPGMDGLEAIGQIRASQPEARILVLTSFAGVDQVLPAIKAGALGYLLKDSGPEVLVQAIRQVHRGNSSLHPEVARKLLAELCETPGREGDEESLTEREMTVLQLVAQGCSNREIADRLAISEATVRTHVSHVLAKLEVSSRTQAALYALRHGWASLEDPEADP